MSFDAWYEHGMKRNAASGRMESAESITVFINSMTEDDEDDEDDLDDDEE